MMKISQYSEQKQQDVDVSLSKINIKSLMHALSKSYLFQDITVMFVKDKSCIGGLAHFDENLIEIGAFEWNHESNLTQREVLTATLVSMFHEREHIIQNHDVMGHKNNIDDEIVLSHLVDSNNASYYFLNYGNNVREVSAESAGIGMAYDYMVHKLNIDGETAFTMIKEYIDFKKYYSNLYDGIPYENAKTMSDLDAMFDTKYECVQHEYETYKAKYTIPILRAVKDGLFKKKIEYSEKTIINKDPAFFIYESTSRY
ncbi:hypothetical protein J6A31_05695 [bacterium]|nr:hypothetical protein [bacterium]